MLKTLFTTVGARFLTNVIQFVLVIATTRYLGDDGKGEVAILVLNITLILQFTQFMGGAALVYLIPRMEPLRILIASYTWALLVCPSMVLALWLFERVDGAILWHTLWLSLIQAVTMIHTMVLMGKNNLKLYNLLTLLQVVFLLVAFLALMQLPGPRTVEDYAVALYVANGLTLLLSLGPVIKAVPRASLKGIRGELLEMMRYGFFVQLGNTAQLLNYRLSFWILEDKYGEDDVGVYSTGVQLSEVFWVIPKGISTALYPHISNSDDPDASRREAIDLLKFSFYSVSILMIPALLMPESFYQFIFGDDFGGVKNVMYFLAPGIAVFSASSILSAYFAGTGKHATNATSSFIGLGLTLILAFTLIPPYGMVGAALSATGSYFSATVYQFAVFLKQTKTPLGQLGLSKNDLNRFSAQARKFVRSLTNRTA